MSSRSFSYSWDPSASDRDWVRWRLGDTDCDDPLLYDEEIDGLLTLYGTARMAAAAAARSLALRFARKVDITMGKLRIAHSQRAQQYREMADEIETEGDGLVSAAPWSASISRSVKRSYREDTDRTRPAFARGMHDVEPGQHGEREVYGNSTESDLE